MGRRQTQRRRWALWGSVIALLAFSSIFSAGVIGTWLGTVFAGAVQSDPFNFEKFTYQAGDSLNRFPSARKLEGPMRVARGEGRPNPVSTKDFAKNPRWKKRYAVGTERDAIGIQESIYASADVRIPPGDYLINIPLKLRNGLNLRGPGVRLIGVGAMRAGTMLFENVEDVRIVGITFVNMALAFRDSKKIQIVGASFAHDVSTRSGSAQLSLRSLTGDTRIEKCRFIRQGRSTGLGIDLQRTEGVRISNNAFMGRYSTAISVIGACPMSGRCNRGTDTEPQYDRKHRNRNVLLDNNKIHRVGEGIGDGFGVNVWGVMGFAARRNKINGWPVNKRSACFKIGNGEGIEIIDNRCDAGIYISHGKGHPKYLREVSVRENVIRISPELIPRGWQTQYQQWLKGSPRRLATQYAGIIVQRNYGDDQPSAQVPERELSIRDNKLKNGIVRIRGVLRDAVTVVGNQAALCRWPTGLRGSRENKCSIFN